MDGWHIAHLVALGLWGGIVLAESVLEAVGLRDRAHTEVAARVHYWIDLFCEVPVLVAVVVTGTVLMLQVPLTTLHYLKIGCGLFAVGVNLWCVKVVVRRYQLLGANNSADLVRETRRVFVAIKLGGPAAMVALYLGLRMMVG